MQQRAKRKLNQSQQNPYHPIISQAGSVSHQESPKQKIVLSYHEYLKRVWSFGGSNISKEEFLALLKLVDISVLIRFENFSKLFEKYPLSDTELFDVATFAISKNKFALIEYLFNVQDYKQLPHIGAEGNHKTLLHEACYYGSKEIIEFLLSKGAMINAVYNGFERPIHLLIKNLKNDVNLLEILKKYGADLNEVDPHFLISVLHRAKVYQNEKAVVKLIQLGANKEMLCGGLTYIQFADLVKKTKNTNPQTKACIEALRAPYAGNCNVSIETSAFCEWWSLLFLPVENKNFRTFQQNHKAFFQKIFKDCSANLGTDLFYYASSSFFMSSNLTLGEIKHFCKNYAPSKKIPHSMIADILPNLINFFLSWRELITLNELAVMMLEMVAQSGHTGEVKAMFYVDASNAFLNTGNIEQGKKAVSDGLTLVNKDSDPKAYAYLLYNLSLLERMAGQPTDLNIQSAHELLPKDMEIAVSYYNHLITQQKYETAVSLCKKLLPNNQWEILLRTIEYLMGQRKVEKFLWALDVNTDEHNFMQGESATDLMVFDVRCFFCIELGRADAAIELAKKRFNAMIRENNCPMGVVNFLTKLLSIYIKSKKYEEGLKFFHEIQQSNPFILSIGSEVKEVLIALYLANNQFDKAELLVKEIESRITLPAQKILNDLLAICVPTDNPQAAVEYLDKVITFFPDQVEFHYYRYLFSNLIQNENIEPAQLEYFDPEVLENTALQNDLLIKADNVLTSKIDLPHETQTTFFTDNESFVPELMLPCEYDPVQIHQYFQQQKEKKLVTFAQKYQVVLKFDAAASWVIGGKTFKDNTPGVISLHSEFCPNAFVALDPALKLDESLLRSFQRGLSKGLCLRQKDQEGIKIVKNSVAYIKVVHEDCRIYTTKVYMNADGQRLYLLDSIGNHAKLEKLLRKPKPFEIIMTITPTMANASFNVALPSPEQHDMPKPNLDSDSKLNQGPNC